MSIKNQKKAETNAIKAQIAITETAVKMEALTKEMQKLKTIATKSSTNLNAVMEAKDLPVVRKRQSKKKPKKTGSLLNPLNLLSIVLLIFCSVASAASLNESVVETAGSEKINVIYTRAYVEDACSIHEYFVKQQDSIIKSDTRDKLNLALENIGKKFLDGYLQRKYSECLNRVLNYVVLLESFQDVQNDRVMAVIRDAKLGEEKCKQMHNCQLRCKRHRHQPGSKNGNCTFDSIDYCLNAVYAMQDDTALYMKKSFDNVRYKARSYSYGCSVYEGWKTLGWLRAPELKNCQEDSSRNCEVFSCVEGSKGQIYRTCERVPIQKTVTEWGMTGECLLGSNTYNQSVNVIYSEKIGIKKTITNDLCTLPCFDKNLLFHHFNNQPACSNCIVPFEILWKKGCFETIGNSESVKLISIYKKHTHFKFENSEFDCRNEYDFNLCCGGRGPSEEGTHSNLVDKYCHCSLKSDTVYTFIYRNLHILYQAVLTPQFAFHVIVFMIVALYNRTIAVVYIVIMLAWVIPTSQADCTLEQLLPSDLTSSFGKPEIQEMHVKVGQCFQAGGASFEVSEISAYYPYAFKKYVPYHLNPTCVVVDWGCRYGRYEQVYTKASKCYEDCVEGIKVQLREVVPSFPHDACAFGSSVPIRIDACFLGGGMDTYVSIFEKLTMNPKLKIKFIAHEAGMQKDFVYDTEDQQTNEYIKIHEFSVSDAVLPKLLAHRLGKDYCSNTYVETSKVCNSRDFSDPHKMDENCLNIKKKWMSDEDRYGLQFDSNDYEHMLMDKFFACQGEYERTYENDNLMLVRKIEFAKLLIEGKFENFAKGASDCDLGKIQFEVKKGVSGYHSSTLLTLTNVGAIKCKGYVKLVGCVSTDGSMYLMQPKESVKKNYWCSYNATGKMNLWTANGKNKVVDVNVVKNYVPHTNQYRNFISSVVDNTSPTNIRSVMSNFWQNLNWPEWSIPAFNWFENEFMKVVVTLVCCLFAYNSMLRGNLIMLLLFISLAYIVGFTDYIMAEEIVEFKIVTVDVSGIFAWLYKKLVAEMLFLIDAWVLYTPHAAVMFVETLFKLLFLTVAEISVLFLVLDFIFRLFNAFCVKIAYRSEVVNSNIIHLGIASYYVLRKIFTSMGRAEDVYDSFAVINRKPKIDLSKTIGEMVFCNGPDGKITKEEMRFTMTTDGWQFKCFPGKCYVLGYKQGEKKTWWAMKHCMSGHPDTDTGSFFQGNKYKSGEIKELYSMNPTKFKGEKGYSGYVIGNMNGIWMFEGMKGTVQVWRHIYGEPKAAWDQTIDTYGYSAKDYARLFNINNQFVLKDKYDNSLTPNPEVKDNQYKCSFTDCKFATWADVNYASKYLMTPAGELINIKTSELMKYDQIREVEELELEKSVENATALKVKIATTQEQLKTLKNKKEEVEGRTIDEEDSSDVDEKTGEENNIEKDLLVELAQFRQELKEKEALICSYEDKRREDPIRKLNVNVYLADVVYAHGMPFITHNNFTSCPYLETEHASVYRNTIPKEFWRDFTQMSKQSSVKQVGQTWKFKFYMNVSNMEVGLRGVTRETVLIKDKKAILETYCVAKKLPSNSLMRLGDGGYAVCSFFAGGKSHFVSPSVNHYLLTHVENCKNFDFTTLSAKPEMVCYSNDKGIVHVVQVNSGKISGKIQLTGKFSEYDRVEYLSSGWKFDNDQREYMQFGNWAIDDDVTNISDGKYTKAAIIAKRLEYYQKQTNEFEKKVIPWFNIIKPPNGMLPLSTDIEIFGGKHMTEDQMADRVVTEIQEKFKLGIRTFRISTAHIESGKLYNWLSSIYLPPAIAAESIFLLTHQIDYHPDDDCNNILWSDDGIGYYPNARLGSLVKLELATDWRNAGAKCWNKIRIDTHDVIGTMVTNDWHAHCEKKYQLGICGNASSVGSFFVYPNGTIISQYHVTYGNQMIFKMDGVGHFETGSATFAEKTLDLVQYVGTINFEKLMIGQVYIAFNTFYRVGIYLKYERQTIVSQRNGAPFHVLSPVHRVKGRWVKKKDFGFPGMSGSPIVNKDGVIVGIYGLQVYGNEEDVAQVQSYSPIVTRDQEKKSFFKNCAAVVNEKQLDRKLYRYFTLSCPTGVGKSTYFVWEVAAHSGRSIVVAQPNRVACLNSFKMLEKIHAREKKDGCRPIKLEIKMGTTHEDRNQEGGDIDAATTICFVSYGYLMLRFNYVDKFDFLMLDECHKTDDSDVATVIAASDILNLKQKIIRTSATMDAKEGYDCAEGNTISTTNYKIDSVKLESMRVDDKEKKYRTSEFYLLNNDGKYGVANAEKMCVKIPIELVNGKRVLVFCATKRNCENGVSWCNELGLKGHSVYSGKSVDMESFESDSWIFATNIAQQSITIPGLEVVIDLRVEMRPGLKMVKLEDSITYERYMRREIIDEASMLQRKGRIGRTGPGLYLYINKIDTAVEEVRESVVPEMILKGHLVHLAVDSFKTWRNGKYASVFEKYAWLNVYDYMKDPLIKKYADSLGLVNVSLLPMNEKLKLCLEAEGDWLMLYLRMHCLDEPNLTQDDVPAYIKCRKMKDSAVWWQSYCSFVKVLDQRSFEKVNEKFSFKSFMEYGGDPEMLSEYGQLRFEHMNDSEAHYENIGAGDYEEDCGIVMSLVGGLAFAVTMTGVLHVAVTRKGDREVLSLDTMDENELATAAKFCADNYETNKNGIEGSMSVLQRIKMTWREWYAKMRSFLRKWLPAQMFSSEKEDSCAGIWFAIETAVFGWVNAGATYAGITTMGVWSSMGISGIIGLAYDNIVEIFGPTFAGVLSVAIGAVITYSLGVIPALATIMTAGVIKLIKNVAFPKKTMTGRIVPQLSDIMTLLVGGSLGAGMVHLTAGAGLAGLIGMGNVGIAQAVVSSPFRAGNIGGSILFWRHIYTYLTASGDLQSDWFDNIVGLSGAAFYAFVQTNWISLGIGAIATVAMCAARWAIKQHYEKISIDARGNNYGPDWVSEKMENFDMIVGRILDIVCICIDPMSLISMFLECVFSWAIGSRQSCVKAAWTRAGVPVYVQIVDMIWRAGVMYAKEQNHDGTSKNLLEMLTGLFEHLWKHLSKTFNNFKEWFVPADDLLQFQMLSTGTDGVWSSFTYLMNSMWKKLKKFWDWVLGRGKKIAIETVDELATQTVVNMTSRTVKNIPIVKNFFGKDNCDLSEDKPSASQSLATNQMLFDIWKDRNYICNQKTYAMYVVDRAMETINKDIRWEDFEIEYNKVWKMRFDFPLDFVKVSNAAAYQFFKNAKYKAKMTNTGIILTLLGVTVTMDTFYEHDHVFFKFTLLKGKVFVSIQKDGNNNYCYIYHTFDSLADEIVMKQLKEVFQLDGEMSLLGEPEIVESAKKIGMKVKNLNSKALSSFFKALKNTGEIVKLQALRKIDLPPMPETLPEKLWYIWNEHAIIDATGRCEPVEILEYACPWLNYGHLHGEKMLGIQANSELGKNIEVLYTNEELLNKTIKRVDLGGRYAYLHPGAADITVHMKSFCKCLGIGFVFSSGSGKFLWSHLGSTGVVLEFTSENQINLRYNAEIPPFVHGKVELQTFLEESWDGYRKIDSNFVREMWRANHFELPDIMETVLKPPLKTQLSSVLQEEIFVDACNDEVTDSDGVISIFVKCFTKLFGDSEDAKLKHIANLGMVKRMNRYLTKLDRADCFEEEEYTPVNDNTEIQFRALKIDGRLYTNPAWSVGFEFATRGPVDMTWYPEDRFLEKSYIVNHEEVMQMYLKLNQRGNALESRTWEKIRHIGRYELPKRITADENNFEIARSRGFWKMQQLDEITDFIAQCKIILDPCCGYGGGVEFISTRYSRAKSKIVYASTLLEQEHRMPDWNQFTAANSNVNVVRCVDEYSPGKGNIKDKGFREELNRIVEEDPPDLLILDVGEYKNGSQAQTDYWMKTGDKEDVTSLLIAIQMLILMTQVGSKLIMKFTGVWQGGSLVFYEVLKYYQKVRIVKLGSTSLFSPEFYIMATGRTFVNNGLTRSMTDHLYGQIASMQYSCFSEAMQLTYSNVHCHRKPLKRSDWVQPPVHGIAYKKQEINTDGLPQGFIVKLENTPFGKLNETFSPDWQKRLCAVKNYFYSFCNIVTKKFVTASRIGFKNIKEIGFYSMKKNVVKEKHTKNAFISEVFYDAFGLDDDNSTYAHTQATEEFKQASMEKRLDVDPGDLRHDVFVELMDIVGNMKTEFGEALVGKCKMLKWEQVLIAMNKGGATGLFSKHNNLRNYIEQNSDMHKSGVPMWYYLAETMCLEPWLKGEGTHGYVTVMHKNEPKAKKNVEEGFIDRGTADSLSKYNNLGHRFIQYNDEITRVAHYILFGDLMSKANSHKVYKGTINGTPPHLVGRLLRAMWDLNERVDKRQIHVGVNEGMELRLKMTGTDVLERHPEDFAAAGLLDYSSWDCTVTKQERYIEYLFVRQFYPESMWPMIKKCCEELAFGICIDRDGNMWVRDGQRGSGEVFFTSFGNTLLVAANTIRVVSKSLGKSPVEILKTYAKLHVDVGGATKTFEMIQVPIVADGDDVVVFGKLKMMEQMKRVIEETLAEANKKCRSGTSAGLEVVRNFKDVSFCSYKYELVLVGKDARRLMLNDKQKLLLVEDMPKDYKIFYLPTRTLPDIFSRMRLTLKHVASKWDPDDDRPDGCKALTRSKLISYLLLYPHVRMSRYACISMLACMGDGNLTKYDIRGQWNQILHTQMTTMGAIKSLYGVDSFDDIGYRQYTNEQRDMRRMQHNLGLNYHYFKPAMRPQMCQLFKVCDRKGFIDHRILQWDTKLFETYCEWEQTVNENVELPDVVMRELKRIKNHRFGFAKTYEDRLRREQNGIKGKFDRKMRNKNEYEI